MSHEKKTILLVEDNILTGLSEKNMLQKYGYDVITVTNGNDAIDLVKVNKNIDCILIDIDLGDEIDGTQVAEKILRIIDIPIIFLSSHTEPEIVEMTEKITSYGYVVKNTGITVLDASIKMAFKLYNARTDLQAKNNDLNVANEQLNVAVEELEAANIQLIQSENIILEREKALAESEERYRSLMQNLPVGVFRIFLTDKNRLADANNALAGITHNSSVDELLNTDISTFFEKPDDLYELLSFIQKEKIVKDKLVKFKRKDDQIAWASVTAECDFDSKGEPELIRGIVEDVTEKIEIEEKLSRYVLFINTLIDAISSPIFYKNREGAYLGCNRVFAEMILGLPREKIINRTIFELEDVIPHELALKYTSKDRELFDSPGTQIYEAPVKCADGVMRVFHFDKTTYNSPEGEVAGLVGVMLDITKRFEYENELVRINEEFNLLITSMSSLIIGVSIKDRITHWNPYAEKIFGIESSVALNKMFYECGIDWNWELIYEAIGQCVIKESMIRLEDIYYTKPNGKKGILGLTVNPLKRGGDVLVGFIILGKELTEQRMMENQLLQSRKLEAIGQLAAGVAHEINTPLQYVGDNLKFINQTFIGLLNILDIYQRASMPRPDMEYFSKTVKQAEELADKIKLSFILEELPKAITQSLEGVAKVSGIVQSMKAFSHPGKGQKIPANINKAIENTVTVSRNEWKYDSELELKLDDLLPEVPCFESEFNQVLLNLIINASDAIREAKEKKLIEKGLITISTERKGENAVIIVSDNGGGIPDRIKDKIFDPFFTTKEIGKGTGQGLAISFSIIHEKHGGSLSFESKVGEGTSFIISLPIEEG